MHRRRLQSTQKRPITHEPRSVGEKSGLPNRNHAKFRLFEIARNEQRELVQQLNQIVRSTDEFRAAEAEGKLVRLPVGDSMAPVFFNNPEAPVQCLTKKI